MKLTARRRFFLNWFPHRAVGERSLPADRDRFDLFLLMGQSNMAGFGCVREDDPWQAGDFDFEPGVFAFGGQSKVKSARPQGLEVWRPAAHPLHLNQQSCGFGLGLPFAKKLRVAAPDRGVGLIPCAWGGAPIDQLNGGTPLFENAMRRARKAAESGRIRAVLWHQGESDTRNAEQAEGHAVKLRQLMTDLRTELGDPTLPFLIGDLGEFTEVAKRKRRPEAAVWNARVRQGLRDVADGDGHAAFVESAGLSGVDDVHFGRDSLIEFGGRYAEAWLKRFAPEAG